MNVAQILRLALYNIDAVKQDSTTDPFFTQTELLGWANDGKDKVEKVARLAREDYGLLLVQSDDDAYRWQGITYDPSSLQLTSTVRRYTLPPDLLTLKYIRCITTGYEDIQFVPRDMSNPTFRDLLGDTSTDTSVFYFDVVGERTLYLASLPPTTLDIEIGYIARSTPLQLYTTGTVTLTQDSATVSGGSTTWIIDEVQNIVDLIPSTDANAPKIVSQTSGGTWVDPAITYYLVQSIDSDGGLTLAGAWLPADRTGVGYMLATVPSVPHEHHHLIADYVSYRALKKAGSARQDHFKEAFEDGLKEMRADIQVRQTHDPILVEDVDFWR